MGKASTNKKVARAAGIGGSRAYRPQRPWGYYGIIVVILVLGIVGTVVSRDRRIAQINNAGGSAPTVGTTWHEGYAVYICGAFVEPAPKGANPIKVPSAHGQGIETQQTGIILIAPESKSVAGKNATLGKFASTVGMKLNAAEIQLPGGKLYQDGDSCGGKPGHIYVREFAGTTDKVGTLYDGKSSLARLDPQNVPLKDNDLITIAFVPSSDASKIPGPPDSVYKAVAALQASESTTATTTPGASTSTTVAGATSSTTAASATTTTPTTAGSASATTVTTNPVTSTTKP
jgi:hypothetical protein